MSLPNIQYWNNIFPPLEPTFSPIDGALPMDRDIALNAALKGNDWHRNVLKLVGSWVAKGNTDAEIYMIADHLTLDGYNTAQTREEVRLMIDGARNKGFGQAANSNQQGSIPQIKKILTLISDVELKDPEYLIDDVIGENLLLA